MKDEKSQMVVVVDRTANLGFFHNNFHSLNKYNYEVSIVNENKSAILG